MTVQEIATAKTKYGTIGMHNIGGHNFFYRFMTYKEYNTIRTSVNLDPDELEEAVCTWCLLDPVAPDWEKYPPTTPAELATAIVSQSGYQTPEEMVADMDEKRAAAEDDIITYIIVKLCQVFNYNPEELRSWSVYKLMDEVVLAEMVSGEKILASNIEEPPRRNKMPASHTAEGMPPIPGHQSGMVNIPQSPTPMTGNPRQYQQSQEQLTNSAMDVSHEALARTMATGGAGDKIPVSGYDVKTKEEKEYYERLGSNIDKNKQRIRELEAERGRTGTT
jgi:hypothetical protein